MPDMPGDMATEGRDGAEAYYSAQHSCWFVPIATELVTDEELLQGVSPVQVQLRDGTLWITRLPREGAEHEAASTTLRRVMAIPTPAGNEYADQVWSAIRDEPKAAGAQTEGECPESITRESQQELRDFAKKLASGGSP